MSAVASLDDLKARVDAGQTEFAISLNFGAYSRKTIFRPDDRWTVVNHIDDTIQRLTDEELHTESNIGQAIESGALWPHSDDTLRMVKDRGYVQNSVLEAEIKASAIAAYEAEKAVNDANPLAFVLAQAPGALRMGEDADVDWEPADPSLTIEVCDIGPATVASIDLAAAAMFSDGQPQAATTSIELTIEDIDGIIATLTRIREDAIANRNFALDSEGFWTNGRD